MVVLVAARVARQEQPVEPVAAAVLVPAVVAVVDLVQ
jgi:hypothetical protein